MEGAWHLLLRGAYERKSPLERLLELGSTVHLSLSVDRDYQEWDLAGAGRGGGMRKPMK